MDVGHFKTLTLPYVLKDTLSRSIALDFNNNYEFIKLISIKQLHAKIINSTSLVAISLNNITHCTSNRNIKSVYNYT